MAQQRGEPLDFDPNDPGDVQDSLADPAESIRNEKGATQQQKMMQAMAYQLAHAAHKNEFDFSDPENLKQLQAAAADLKANDPAEVLRLALAEHGHKLAPEQRKELAAQVLGVGGGQKAAQPGRRVLPALDLSGTQNAPQPQAAGQPVSAPAQQAPVEGAAGIPNISASLTPGAVLQAKGALVQNAADEKMAGYEAGMRAQAPQDEVDLHKKEQLLGVSQEYENQLKDINTKYQEQLDGQMAHYRSAVDELRATNPNPFADRGTGWKIASALFIGMNQLGLSMVGSNAPNLALQQIKDGINQDLQGAQFSLDAKKSGVMREGQLLERMREVWGDNKTALQAAKVSMLEHVSQQAERELASKKPEIRGAQAEQFFHGIQAEMSQEQQKLLDMAMMQKHQMVSEDTGLAQTTYKQKTAQILSGNKSATARTKLDGADEKVYSDFVGALAGTRGAPDVAKAKTQLMQAKTALGQAAQYKNLDDMPIGQYRTFLHELLKVASGGVGTEAAMHGLTADTLESKLEEVKGKVESKPIGAGLGAFIKDNVAYLKDLYKIHEDHIREYEMTQFKRYRGRFNDKLLKRAKEDFPYLFGEEAASK